jgi:acetyltransferase-like isoleucine patch superfamily enzyme
MQFLMWHRKHRPNPFTAQDLAYKNHMIGEWTYGKPSVRSWGEGARLHVGRFCSIADGVAIFLGGEHRTEWVTTYPFSEFFEEGKGIPGDAITRGDVRIGSDVWIGQGACILSGVEIGDGAVIGARAVVAKSVAPYAVVVGNPARIVRYRFNNETIAALLRIRWWDWPIADITAAIPSLMSDDIEAFVSRHDPALRSQSGERGAR